MVIIAINFIDGYNSFILLNKIVLCCGVVLLVVVFLNNILIFVI
jgi:hypothetical protein